MYQSVPACSAVCPACLLVAIERREASRMLGWLVQTYPCHVGLLLMSTTRRRADNRQTATRNFHKSTLSTIFIVAYPQSERMRVSTLILLATIPPCALAFAAPSSIARHGLNNKPATFLAGFEKGATNIARKERFTFRNTASTTVHSLSQGDDDADDAEIKKVKSKLTREFFTIACPAFIQLAAEPLASLVDTAYLGR